MDCEDSETVCNIWAYVCYYHISEKRSHSFRQILQKKVKNYWVEDNVQIVSVAYNTLPNQPWN